MSYQIDDQVNKEINHMARMLPKDTAILPNGVAIAVKGINHRMRIKQAFINEGWIGFMTYVIPYHKPGETKNKLMQTLNQLINEANEATDETATDQDN